MSAHHIVLRLRITALGRTWRAVCLTSGCEWAPGVRVQPTWPGTVGSGWNPEQAFEAALADKSRHLDATGSPVDVVDRAPGVHWASGEATVAEQTLDPAGIGDEVEAWLRSR